MKSSIAARRLIAQHLEEPRFDTPAALVTWLGAVQAQDYGAAKWALAMRIAGSAAATDSAIQRAIDEGQILRTHAMRGTWQIIGPDDVGWILELVAARTIDRAATRHAQLGLDNAVFAKSNAAIAKALRDGSAMTRAELAAVLKKSRVPCEAERLSHLLWRAELETIITSGPRRGKQNTHVLHERRVATGRVLRGRDAKIIELAKRYFASRGPATIGDFIWWSGLAPAEARRGLEELEGTLARETIDGREYFGGPEGKHAGKKRALLLPAFDEYLVAYKDRDDVLDPAHVAFLNAGGGLLNPAIAIAGRVIGRWWRTLARDQVTIELSWFEPPPSAAAKRAAEVAAQRYAKFLGLEPETRERE